MVDPVSFRAAHTASERSLCFIDLPLALEPSVILLGINAFVAIVKGTSGINTVFIG